MSAEPRVPDPDAEWHAARKKCIGGSDAAAVLGVSRWSSPMKVWAEKRGLVEREPESEAMLWGRLHEPIIAARYADLTGKRLVKPPFMRHRAREWMGASIDRLVVGEKLLVEIKTSTTSEGWGQPGTDEVPDDYFVQVQHEMEVSGLPAAECPVLIRGNQLRVYRVERHEVFIAEMVRVEEEFWTSHVLTGVPPSADASESCGRILAERYPGHEPGKVLVATAEDYTLAEELRQAREATAMAEEARTLAENRVKARMGDAEALVGEGWRLTWKKAADSRSVEWQVVAAALAQQLGIGGTLYEAIKEEHMTVRRGSRRFLARFDEADA